MKTRTILMMLAIIATVLSRRTHVKKARDAEMCTNGFSKVEVYKGSKLKFTYTNVILYSAHDGIFDTFFIKKCEKVDGRHMEEEEILLRFRPKDIAEAGYKKHNEITSLYIKIL